MIAYFDTSALVSLLFEGPGTPCVRRLWDAACARVSSRLLYVEASAALTQARRTGRLTGEQWRGAIELLDGVWDRLDVVNVGEALVQEAAELARHCDLRGYAAVHCASARRFVGDDIVVISGDQRLLEACRQLGMATADPS